MVNSSCYNNLLCGGRDCSYCRTLARATRMRGPRRSPPAGLFEGSGTIMKKVAIVTVAVLALGLAACNKNNADNNAANETAVRSEERRVGKECRSRRSSERRKKTTTHSYAPVSRTWNESAAAIFFFQAEDGIRDGRVTGVQTCALPICLFEGSGTIMKKVAIVTVAVLALGLAACNKNNADNNAANETAV